MPHLPVHPCREGAGDEAWSLIGPPESALALLRNHPASGEAARGYTPAPPLGRSRLIWSFLGRRAEAAW